MADIMTSVGDISSLLKPKASPSSSASLVGDALASSPAPKPEAPAPYTGPSQSIKDVVAAGGISPATNVGRAQAQEEVARDYIDKVRSTQVMPEQASQVSAMRRASALLSLPEDDIKKLSSWYETALPNFEKKMLEAKALYEQKSEQLGEEKAKVAMFSILGHLAMGIYGAQHGVDTSGIKFDQTDWAARYNKILQEYKMTEDLEESKYRKGESRASRIESILRWAQEEEQRRENEKARVLSGNIEAENFKNKAKAELLTKESAGEQRIQKGNEAISRKEEELKDRLARADQLVDYRTQQALAKEQRADVDRLAAAVANTKDGAKKFENTRLLADKLGAPTFEQWKNSPEAERGWFSSDEQDYVSYVKGLLDRMPSGKIAPSTTTPQATPKAASNYTIMTKPDGTKVQVRNDMVEAKKSQGYK